MLDLFDDTASAGDQLARIRDTLDVQLRERRGTSRAVTDVFVYYVGHGYTDDQGQLALLVRRSRRNMEAETGIKAADLARALRLGAPQQRRSIVLDCCFSETAAKTFIGMSGDLNQQVAATAMKDLQDNQPARGTLLLCSSPVGQVSMGPPNAEYTLFTGAVLEVLHNGAVGFPQYLSFADLRDQAFERMVVSFGASAPRPVLHQVSATHGDLTRAPAFRNRAGMAIEQAEEERHQQALEGEKRGVEKKLPSDTADADRRAEKESFKIEAEVDNGQQKELAKAEVLNWFDVKYWSYQKIAVVALVFGIISGWTVPEANLSEVLFISPALLAGATSLLVTRLTGRGIGNSVIVFVILYVAIFLSIIPRVSSSTSFYTGDLPSAAAQSVLIWLIVASNLGFVKIRDTMFAIAAAVGAAKAAVGFALFNLETPKLLDPVLLKGFVFLSTALMLTYGIRSSAAPRR